jgi:hypothetical protein
MLTQKKTLAPIHRIGDSCLSLVLTFINRPDHFNMMIVDKIFNKVSSSPESWDTIKINCPFSYWILKLTKQNIKIKSLKLCKIITTDFKMFKYMMSVKNTKNIKRLFIDSLYTKKNTKLPSFLKHLTMLDHITIINCDINNNTFVGIDSLRYLKHLELEGTLSHNTLPSCIHLHPDLKKTLEYLSLKCFCKPSIVLDDLKGSSSLTKINFSSVINLNDKCASSIRSMTSLKEIELYNCQFSDLFWEEISKSVSIKIIRIINDNYPI